MFILGPYNKIVLLGGGELLRELVAWALSSNYPISVLTSPSHSQGKSMGKRWKSRETSYAHEFD